MRWVFFDTETAGLTYRHATIQIAAVAVEGGREVGVYEAKIKFDESLAEPEALEKNCYDRALWEATAVGVKAAYGGFLDFLREHATVEKLSKAGNRYSVARLAGYNIAHFDYPRLKSHCAALAKHDHNFSFIPADPYLLDVYELLHWVATIKNLPLAGRKLTDMMAYYGMPVSEAHDALADARATVAVARHLIAAIQNPKGASHDHDTR